MTLQGEELSCRELVGLVTDYFEDALPPVARARFEHHLDLCEGCRNHLEHVQTTLRIVGRLRCPDLSAEAEASLLAAFRTWKLE